MKTLFAALLMIAAPVILSAGQGYKVGDNATDFNLKNVDGKMVSLDQYPDAKGFIVIFTCNHCPYSIAYEDRIIALDKEFAPKGYPVIAINPNDPEVQPQDSFAEMQKRAKNKKFTFPYLYDQTQEIAKAYGATRTPHVFILDKEDSNLKVAYIGAIDDSARDADNVESAYVSNAVHAVMKSADPDPDFTKAIGCSIKWARK